MLKVFNPADQSLIKELPFVGKAEVDAALNTAYALFQDQSKWLPPHQRIEILERTAKIMEGRVEELTQTAAREGGKPYVDSKVEVLRAINGVKIAIEHIPQLKGEQIPMGLTLSSDNRIAYTFREPIGVVAAVSAFNHPLNLIIHQTVTAIAAGCPVIVKPAETTPLSCLAFVDILKEAGLPEDWCQAVICEVEAAEHLVTDPRVNYFTFIGSAKVGWYLRSKLSPGTRCALEHGGAAPVLVEKDADIEDMLPALLKGGFYHAGQVCVSVQRVFIHEDICEEVAHRFAEMAKKLVVGDQLDEKTEVGPLILPREVDRVEAWVNEAVEGGAKVLCGGNRISESFYEPTVLLNPPADAKVSTLEIFGPVVCIYSYSDREEAIKRANELDVHFQAAVYTKNLDLAMDAVKKLNANGVMVNDHTAFRVDWMPFGGRDTSGIGMGGIQYTMHEMTREKLFVIKSKVL
ncbi:aldehyde dehydrogenase family protein [Xanthovirga aplysinae]|uniref:aldehyde dehydrogenase family protein n=1 Tax=Xanthovirga aplysinae TaxID=2529853 RepID=UPI0012BD3AA8|nr:aldehyde dehydrogenase family protein [Xanthovirga aplysinae]